MRCVTNCLGRSGSSFPAVRFRHFMAATCCSTLMGGSVNKGGASHPHLQHRLTLAHPLHYVPVCTNQLPALRPKGHPTIMGFARNIPLGQSARFSAPDFPASTLQVSRWWQFLVGTQPHTPLVELPHIQVKTHFSFICSLAKLRDMSKGGVIEHYPPCTQAVAISGRTHILTRYAH